MNPIAKAKRLVVKVGTSTLTYETGKINIRRMVKLCSVLADLHNSGKDVVLVKKPILTIELHKMLFAALEIGLQTNQPLFHRVHAHYFYSFLVFLIQSRKRE